MNTVFQQDLLDINDIQVKHSYATFWFRFWALVIDGLILAMLAPLMPDDRTESGSNIVFIVISCIRIGYKPFFECAYGATPGKMALHLRVLNYGYGKASFNQVFLRNIFHISGGLISLVIGLFNTYQLPVMYVAQGITRISFNFDFSRVIFFIILLIDMFFLLSSPDRRSLHDRIGQTIVVIIPDNCQA